MGVAGSDQRLHRPDDEIDLVDRCRSVGVLGQQGQCILEVPGGIGRSGGSHCGVACAHRSDEGQLDIPGGAGMPGQIGGCSGTGAVTERVSETAVQPDPLAGEQVVVDRFGEEGMAKGVAA